MVRTPNPASLRNLHPWRRAIPRATPTRRLRNPPPEMASGFNSALARLIAGQVCLHACMAGTRMAAPLLALREGQSEAAVGVLLALFALTQVFLALPAGRYADRHGLKRPVGFAVLAATAGAGLAVVLPTFPALCISALLTGG